MKHAPVARLCVPAEELLLAVIDDPLAGVSNALCDPVLETGGRPCHPGIPVVVSVVLVAAAAPAPVLPRLWLSHRPPNRRPPPNRLGASALQMQARRLDVVVDVGEGAAGSSFTECCEEDVVRPARKKA